MKKSLWHRLIKIFYHFFTRKSEILRICDLCKLVNNPLDHSIYNIQLEKSLNYSKYKELNCVLYFSEFDAIESQIIKILRLKFVPDFHIDWKDKDILHENLSLSSNSDCDQLLQNSSRNFHLEEFYYNQMHLFLNNIVVFNQFTNSIIFLATVPYSENDIIIDNMLNDIWCCILPDEDYNVRPHESWKKIGFQGKNPSTDFRGLGLLGLKFFHFFSKNQNGLIIKYDIRSIYLKSIHPTQGYPLAICVFNIVSLTIDLMKSGLLKSTFYHKLFLNNRKSFNDEEILDIFFKFTLSIFIKFHHFWFESSAKSIMQFNQIKNDFQELISGLLITSNYLIY